MADDPISVIIDRLLAAKKTLAGVPFWQTSPRHADEKVFKWPLRIDDVPCGADLQGISYPYHNNGKEKWRILITMQQCIWRIDYDNVYHVNSLNKPSDMEYSFTGQHYHAWEDNKRFCAHSTLPEKLHNARLLPCNIKTFHNSLRWFCDKTNIDLPSGELIDLPPREKLI